MYVFYRHDPICLVLEHDGEKVNMLKFISEEKYWEHQALELSHYFTNDIRKKLEGYFDGSLKDFDLPIIINGSEFEEKVWAETRKIPYGETISYGELARRIGNPEAAQAVGQALGKNILLLLIPCHRVIGSDGELHGFAGGVDKKEWLLAHEAKHK